MQSGNTNIYDLPSVQSGIPICLRMGLSGYWGTSRRSRCIIFYLGLHPQLKHLRHIIGVLHFLRAPMNCPTGYFLCHSEGAYGNVTEELFVLTLLLCNLVPCSVQGSLQQSHPTAGAWLSGSLADLPPLCKQRPCPNNSSLRNLFF